MKINFNDIKITPKGMDFDLCVFGSPNTKVQEWIEYWDLSISPSGNFTNINISGKVFENMFFINDKFSYMDGFSPNLNKYLHIGHLSNFIIANALQHLGISEKTISILGDTLNGNVDSQIAFEKYKNICNKFNYNIDDIYFASGQKLKDDFILSDGNGDYKGTKVFKLSDGQELVGIKNDGSTTYFYQDVALAEKLNKPTLYITGQEQENHFKQLKNINENINHIGLGLVLIDGKKMSSSSGNIISIEEVFEELGKIFNDEYLIYNILAGQFLKYNLSSNKNIKMKDLSNPKNSDGLYLSYTLAKLHSAGLTLNSVDFDEKLNFIYLKSKNELNPSLLLLELKEIAKKINQLYLTNIIKDNEENQVLFTKLGNQLLSGMKKLGMFDIIKV